MHHPRADDNSWYVVSGCEKKKKKGLIVAYACTFRYPGNSPSKEIAIQVPRLFLHTSYLTPHTPHSTPITYTSPPPSHPAFYNRTQPPIPRFLLQNQAVTSFLPSFLPSREHTSHTQRLSISMHSRRTRRLFCECRFLPHVCAFFVLFFSLLALVRIRV